MRKTTILLLVCAALAGRAQVPCKWTVDLSRAAPANWDCLRGETLELTPSFVSGRGVADLSGVESATLYWQTNGMGSAYWSRPAAVDTNSRPHRLVARWTPDCDCGAPAYAYFVGASSPSGIQYRAFGTVRMRGAPGFSPNALPLPVPFIDFAKVAWTNAPWGEGGGTDGEAVTNIVNGIVADVLATNTVEEVDPVFADWKNGDRVMAGNGSAANSDAVAIGPGARATGSSGGLAGASGRAVPEAVALGADAVILARGAVQIGAGQNAEPDSLKFRDYQLLDAAGLIPDGRLPGNLAHIDDFAPYATRAWTLSTYGGTNAWMAIDGDLLGIYSCTNAAAGTNTLWESSSAFGGDLADVARRATNNTVRITALEARPDLTSWGDYAPDGTPNPDAEAMVYLNKALTLMGSGFSWATSGSYACLCQSGAVAFQVENAGEIRIGTDIATNYFGLVQGGSVTVGCRTDGIRVADGVAYLSYAYAGGAFPVVWFCGDLAEGVWQETSPVWTDNGDGTATAAVPAIGSRGFWKATSTRETGAYFRSNVPAHFPAGVYGALAAEPVRYDSVITVQSGGHTYRIPAELVQ